MKIEKWKMESIETMQGHPPIMEMGAFAKQVSTYLFRIPMKQAMMYLWRKVCTLESTALPLRQACMRVSQTDMKLFP